MNPVLAVVLFIIAFAVFFGAILLVIVRWLDFDPLSIAKSIRGAFSPPPPKAAPPPPPPAKRYPQWRVNLTDRLVEVTISLKNSDATIMSDYTPEEARHFASNLNLLADVIERHAAAPPEETL